ncbi:hypothetical protein PMAYCL1PPCAC_13908, partial [Pristionchus mayeri]
SDGRATVSRRRRRGADPMGRAGVAARSVARVRGHRQRQLQHDQGHRDARGVAAAAGACGAHQCRRRGSRCGHDQRRGRRGLGRRRQHRQRRHRTGAGGTNGRIAAESSSFYFCDKLIKF